MSRKKITQHIVDTIDLANRSNGIQGSRIKSLDAKPCS